MERSGGRGSHHASSTTPSRSDPAQAAKVNPSQRSQQRSKIYDVSVPSKQTATFPQGQDQGLSFLAIAQAASNRPSSSKPSVPEHKTSNSLPARASLNVSSSSGQGDSKTGQANPASIAQLANSLKEQSVASSTKSKSHGASSEKVKYDTHPGSHKSGQKSKSAANQKSKTIIRSEEYGVPAKAKRPENLPKSQSDFIAEHFPASPKSKVHFKSKSQDKTNEVKRQSSEPLPPSELHKKSGHKSKSSSRDDIESVSNEKTKQSVIKPKRSASVDSTLSGNKKSADAQKSSSDHSQSNSRTKSSSGKTDEVLSEGSVPKKKITFTNKDSSSFSVITEQPSSIQKRFSKDGGNKTVIIGLDSVVAPKVQTSVPVLNHHKQHEPKKTLKKQATSSSSGVSLESVATTATRLDDVHVDLTEIVEDQGYKPVHSTEGIQVQLGIPSAPYHRIVHVTTRSICLSCAGALLLLLGSLLMFGPVLVLVIVLVPLCLLVKRLCDVCCCCRYCGHCCSFCCTEHVSQTEQIWLQKSPSSCPVVQSLVILQHGMDIDRIRDLINARLISAEDRRGNRLYPRFTQRIVPFCCGYAWVNDRRFIISNHIFDITLRLRSLEDLQEYIADMASHPLPMEYPLWDIQIYQNFGPQRDTVLLFRMHPCMTDGISMIQILQQALVDSQDVVLRPFHRGIGPAFLGTFRAFFFGPLLFCYKYLCLKNDFNLLHGNHVHPSGEMAIAWSAPFSIRAATRIKQVARCTLNELFMAVTAGNIRTYMQLSGITNPFNLKCVIPIDFHSGAANVTDMANKYTLAVLPLLTNVEGAIPRLWGVKTKMDEFKQSPEAAAVKGAMWLTSAILTKRAYSRLWSHIYGKTTCLISNLAGPENTLRLASHEIKCIMYWLPPMDRVTLVVSFLTYGDQIRMSVISDRSVLPNPEVITKDFIFQMETLSKLLAHRRIPGEQLHRRMESMHLLSSYTLSDLTAEQLQLQMSLIQNELHDLKLQVESESTHKISHNETHCIKKIENLKEQFRELMVELRRKKATDSEGAVTISSEEEYESDPDRVQRPFRRRTTSVSSKMSTSSVASTIRPLSTAPPSSQPSPTHVALPSWPELEVNDIQEAFLTKRVGGYRQQLSTMEEYEMEASPRPGSSRTDHR
ncbi:uncharacterized protein LOC121372465 [Gigantopelta aegis]|uniref:uncharacterized protein LOC121372465 n=1 Tax=Gigantopelta aegis TaxID=1735272 RepID=UPI001B889485|nr:uncharacterized protein LOC121372465 [Gigantopelta aegis]